MDFNMLHNVWSLPDIYGSNARKSQDIFRQFGGVKWIH